MLQAGDKAPDFRVMTDSGEPVSLTDFAGQNLILYFYPKANTPGWTTEASEFRDAIAQFEALNAAVLGCSGDSVDAQTKFKVKHKLNFPLLADTGFEVIEAFGARRMKSFLGKSFLGIIRMTFWIGPDGKIRKIWDKVTPKGHAAEVLAAIEEG